MDNKLIAQQRADQIQAFYNEVKLLEDDDVFTLVPQAPRYVVELNLGKRLEPWIESVQ